MSTLGFDLDGVIFKSPLHGFLKIWNIDIFLFNLLGNISIIRNFIYQSIRIDRRVVEHINNMSYENDILIISGRPLRDLSLIEKLLKTNNVHFEKLYLKPKGVGHLKFKINKIQETGVFLYFEDKKSMARQIAKICPTMLYKGGKFVSII